MVTDDTDLPNDVRTLQAMLLQARQSMEQMLADIAERDIEIERLKAQIDKLKRILDASLNSWAGRSSGLKQSWRT